MLIFHPFVFCDKMSAEVKINKKTQFMRLRQFYLFFFNDLIWDFKLGIHTVFSDYRGMNKTNYGYDPTPYSVLQKLAKSGWLRKEDTLVDYGCGKGRVGIFLNNQIGCRVVGIDFNERRVRQSNSNLIRYYKNKNRHLHSTLDKNQNDSQQYKNKEDSALYKNQEDSPLNENQNDFKPKIQFIHSKAEEYVPDEANCFYFFNPFSSKIFQKVLNQIIKSNDRNPRRIYIFFYYISREYRNYFPKNSDLVLVDEIDCRKSFLSSRELYKLQIYTLRQ